MALESPENVFESVLSSLEDSVTPSFFLVYCEESLYSLLEEL